nr:PREDICTED: PC-esterase domain-containing protein 1B-like [Rhinolophus sinicus]
MAHLRACEVRQLLHNKFVVVMGDSVQRAVYKDLVLLLQKDCLLSSSQLKAKGELSFEQDVLLEGGRRGRMHNSTHYREVRQFCSGHHLVRFYFLTRVYSQYVVDVLEELRQDEHHPDLVIMNSCLWDLSRYGPNFRRGYRENLESLFGLLDRVLPVSCLLVWNTAMPVAEVVSSSILPTEHQRDASHLREDVIEANFYSSAEASRRGFDVLDLHFHFRHAGQHRQRDGVHWDERAHRHLSQLLLAHVADAWGVDLPCRYPVGRWLRDTPASGSPGRAGGRQPRDNRGDPGEQALFWRPPRSTCHRTPRRPSTSYTQARRLFANYRQDIYVPSHPSLQRREFSHDPPARQVGYTGEANLRISHEPRLGPIRRASTQHRSRRSPPYPPGSPNRPRRHRRRRTDRQTQEWQGLGRQTYT